MGKTAYWESVIVEVQRPGRVNISLHLLGVFLLKILGWKVKGEPPDVPKVVVVVAPHTSYWDYPLALLVSWHFRIKGAWFGKAEIFDWPLVGWIFPGTGGIPVYKDRHEGLVDQIVQAFQERDEIMLVLTPKGTRKKMEFWRSGFYRIALQSGAPISLGYLDFKRKTGGFGPLFEPSGDPEKDLDFIRAYYDRITPRHPDRVGPIKFRKNETF